MLELSRKRAVPRHGGPAVGQDLHVRAAEIDHRLDREEHAGAQHDAFAGPAHVDDVRLVVEQPAEAMAAEVAHDAHVLGFDKGLDRGPDVARGRAGPDHRDAAHHGVVGDIDQALGAARDRADPEHPARVPVPAVEDQRHVDIDDVAFLQRLLARNAMADHVIDRGAGRLAVAAVHQRRRGRLVVHAELEHQAVDLVSRDAGTDLVGQHIQTFRGQLPGLAHALEGGGAMKLDLSGLALGGECGVDVAHQESSPIGLWGLNAAPLPFRGPFRHPGCLAM